MWKKIIIGAVVLFLAASFVFYKNHEAQTTMGGEVETMQTRLQEAITKNKNIEMDKAVKTYAEMRSDWFKSEKTRFEEERAALEAEDAEVKNDTATTQTECETIKADLQKLQAELEKFKQEVAEAAHLEDLDAEGNNMEAVVDYMVTLRKENDAAKAKVASEEAIIADLNKQEAIASALLAAAKKLTQDRQARISPPELNCSVLSVSPQWNYVILDAGIDKGIVIGSRLLAMRGDEKIAELAVTFVEASRASCDVVLDTLKTGEVVQAGDRVISVPKK